MKNDKKENKALSQTSVSSSILHISFAKIDFNCPHCNKQYSDSEDKYVERCNKTKDFCTRIKCECGNRFGMTYDIMGKAVSFKLSE